MRPGDGSISSSEHQETPGSEAHPGCRNAVPQNVLGVLDRSYVHTFIGCLGQAYIKQRQPIRKGLRCETAEDEPNAERAPAALGKITSIVFEVRIDRPTNTRDQPGLRGQTETSHAQVANAG